MDAEKLTDEREEVDLGDLETLTAKVQEFKDTCDAWEKKMEVAMEEFSKESEQFPAAVANNLLEVNLNVDQSVAGMTENQGALTNAIVETSRSAWDLMLGPGVPLQGGRDLKGRILKMVKDCAEIMRSGSVEHRAQVADLIDLTKRIDEISEENYAKMEPFSRAELGVQKTLWDATLKGDTLLIQQIKEDDEEWKAEIEKLEKWPWLQLLEAGKAVRDWVSRNRGKPGSGQPTIEGGNERETRHCFRTNRNIERRNRDTSSHPSA